MLPGFRFLFGAIVVSMSILVFGLGAAALLRTAHEEFASAPVWRPTPETRFAQAVEASQPVIAMLRVDDASTDTAKDAIKDARAEPPPADATAKQGELSPAQPDLDQTASLQSAEPPPSEATKPQAEVLQNPVPENPPQAEATAAPAIPNQPKVATTEQPSAEVPDQGATQTTTEVAKGPATASETAPSPTAEAAPVAPKTFSAPRPAGNALTRIAARDGRPVFIAAPKGENPKAVNAKAEKKKEEAIRRRRAVRRAARRRRIALELRAAQQQAAQQQLNPFAQQPVRQQQPAR
jgi:hypothetical protein